MTAANIAQSAQLKSRFIEIFATCGNVSRACRLAKVPRRTFYEWKDADPEFLAAYQEAERRATEFLEEAAWKRATQGVLKPKRYFYEGREVGHDLVREYSDTLLIFLLKARDPETYREKYEHRHTGSVSEPIVFVEVAADAATAPEESDVEG